MRAISTRTHTLKAFRTWKDLILPNGRDTRIALSKFNETGSPQQTSSFTPTEWHPDKLPSHVYVVNDLPSKMEGHLRHLLDERYAKQAAGTRFTKAGHLFTPSRLWSQLNVDYKDDPLPLYYETGKYASFVNIIARRLFYALTAKNLESENQKRATRGVVITDTVYELDGEIKILWEDKAPKVFDKVIGDFIDKAKVHGSVLTPYLHRPSNLPLSTKTSTKKSTKKSTRESTEKSTKESSATYERYEAILGKISYHSRDTQPPARWAFVFTGLKYMMVYIPRSPRRPIMYCSPILDVCHTPHNQLAPNGPSPLPIWSFIVYMLVAEDLSIDDDVLRQRFCLPEPLEDTSSSELRPSENASHSDKLEEAPTSMLVQPYNALPITLSLIGAHQSQDAKKPSPFVHLDRHYGGGWSSVYASSRSHIIIKFANSPKKDKAELERLLKREKITYDKLSPLTGWAIPHCYGEYLWYGGRALVLSDEGRSLDDLNMDFATLGLTERLILFVQIYLIHYFGVYHGDLEERNVVRKGWCRLKVIDFAFSDVEHRCSGWKECSELTRIWRKLQLDRLVFFPGSVILEKFKSRSITGLIFGVCLLAWMFLS